MKLHSPIVAAEEWVTPKKNEGNFLKDARRVWAAGGRAKVGSKFACLQLETSKNGTKFR